MPQWKQYSGIWTPTQQMQAIAAGTWPLLFDYELYSWGNNADGQLGLGDTTSLSSPVQVGALTTWEKVSSGADFSLATTTDGKLYAWGQGAQGRLGQGNTTSYSSPVQVGALTTWATVGAGQNSSYAIKTDGTLWSWGEDRKSVV